MEKARVQCYNTDEDFLQGKEKYVRVGGVQKLCVPDTTDGIFLLDAMPSMCACRINFDHVRLQINLSKPCTIFEEHKQ